MNVLVTGGAGFIGSHVCERLIKDRHFVVCVDDFNDYYNPKVKEQNVKSLLQEKNFKLYRKDIRDADALKIIFQENELSAIIHLAARAGVRPSLEDPILYGETNINGTINLLELGREFGIKNFVFGSSSSVYGVNEKVPFSEEDYVDNPISPYAASKRAGELYCYVYYALYGINIICLRFFTVYGPGGRPDMAVYKFTKLIDKGSEIEMYGGGESKRDYTYVADIVDGVVASLERNQDLGFEIINLGDSNTVELKYLISLIEQNLGKKARIKQLPEQPGDVPVTYADITKAGKLLGYKPKIKIEEGIKLFVDWFKENG